MTKRKDIKKIIMLFTSILLIAVLLIALVSANKVTETIKEKEDYHFANYGTVRYFFEEFSKVELSIEDSNYVVEEIGNLICEINSKTDYYTEFAIYDADSNIYYTCNENDPLLSELIMSLDNESHRITKDYIYKNYIIGNYRFLLKINHGGIRNIIFDKDFNKSLIFYGLGFVFLATVILLLFYFSKSNKLIKAIGLFVVIIWIGAISLNSANDLMKLQSSIIDEETTHLTSLISYYYKQDIIDQDVAIDDYKAWANRMIYQFSISNDYISSISLNDNYDINDLDISDCLSFTYNEKAINNKNLEFIISALMFLILAGLIYDRLANAIFSAEESGRESHLTKFDNKILRILFVCRVGSCMTWAIVLPRLLEIGKICFTDGGGVYVAAVYSAGIAAGTVISVFSSLIYSSIKKMKHYILMVCALLLSGFMLLGLSNNFVAASIAYFLLYFYYGLISSVPYFYVTSLNEDRKNEYLINSHNNTYVAQALV